LTQALNVFSDKVPSDAPAHILGYVGLLKGLLTFQNFGNVRLLYRLPKRNRKHLNRDRLLDLMKELFN
jgi:hypothetical protein